MLDIGWSEMMVVAIIALLIIGPRDLPRVMRTVGQWVKKAQSLAREFQRGIDDMAREADLEDAKKLMDTGRSIANPKKAVMDAIDPTGAIAEEGKSIKAAVDEGAPPAKPLAGESKAAKADAEQAAPEAVEPAATGATPKAASAKTDTAKTATAKTAKPKAATPKAATAKTAKPKAAAAEAAAPKATKPKAAKPKASTTKAASAKAASQTARSPQTAAKPEPESVGGEGTQKTASSP